MSAASPLPATMVHADWRKESRKRWAAQAHRVDGRYRVEAPTHITPPLLLKLLEQPSTLAGFDLPIGIPSAYARVVGAKL
jgi:hypothetical protein